VGTAHTLSPLTNSPHLLGPYGANVWNPREWGNGDEKVINTVTLELTRVVLAIGVFSIGIELPKQYMKRHWKSLAYLLGPVMTWVRHDAFVFLTTLTDMTSGLVRLCGSHLCPHPELVFLICFGHCCVSYTHGPYFGCSRHWW
jgi:NhaP-type Na+/H+ or K+/H+ antiporter